MNQGGLVNKWVRDEVGKLRSANGKRAEDDGKVTYLLRRVVARSLTLDHLQVTLKRTIVSNIMHPPSQCMFVLHK